MQCCCIGISCVGQVFPNFPMSFEVEGSVVLESGGSDNAK